MRSQGGAASPQWFIYREDGPPIGPLPTELVADAILAGTFAPDVLVAAPGGTKWLKALDVPNIARLIQGTPTRRGPAELGRRSGLGARKFDETERSPSGYGSGDAEGADHAATSPLERPLRPEASPETVRAPDSPPPVSSSDLPGHS